MKAVSPLKRKKRLEKIRKQVVQGKYKVKSSILAKMLILDGLQ